MRAFFMLKLSVAIITLNEERNLERCLRSVQSIADEIIIIDSGSTDATKTIAENYHASFIVHPFEGHIQQKNFAIACCKNEWILSLDADEALSEELNKSIQHIQQSESVLAYSMNRRTNYYGKWIRYGGWYPDKKVRLFQKAEAKWGGENPHDKIIVQENVLIKHLSGDLLHYSFYNFSEHVKQVQRFSQIAANQRKLNGKNQSLMRGVVHAFWAFIRSYIISLGFIEGGRGWNIARMAAWYSYRKYTLNHSL